MLAGFLITFRETLEAALIVGIILAFLKKTKNTRYFSIVYLGIGAGVIASFMSALLFNSIAGGFNGRAEEIFEGVVMLVGAFLLTTVIIWMMKQKNISKEIKEKVQDEITRKNNIGLFMLVFISILREGVETVIFLWSANIVTSNILTGGLIGVAAAIFLGYLMFVASVRIDLKRFFNVSSLLLLLFAAGLVAQGVHELQEASLLPSLIDHVWDINPPASKSHLGIYPLLHEKGIVGSFLAGFLGYNGNPSLLEVVAYILYLSTIAMLLKKV